MAESNGNSALEALYQLIQRGSVRRASDAAKELMKTDGHPLSLVLAMVDALMATHDFDLVKQLLEKEEQPNDPRWIIRSLEL